MPVHLQHGSVKVTGIVTTTISSSAHQGPGCDLHAVITHFIFTATLRSGDSLYPWFIGEETKAQRVAHSTEVAQPGGGSFVPESGHKQGRRSGSEFLGTALTLSSGSAPWWSLL